jgi:hypothetical protein
MQKFIFKTLRHSSKAAVSVIFILMALLAAVSNVHRAAAAGSATAIIATADAATADSCALTPADFNKISTIQNDPSLSYTDELKAELALRKQLLTTIITCATNAAQTLQKTLSDLTIDPSFQNMQLQLSENLASTINYYNLELAKVPDAGVRGTQLIAKDVLDWRESNYTPLAANVSNFILWSQNQALFAAAGNRLAQVTELAQSVPFSDNADLKADLQAASTSLKTAQDANAAAKDTLAHLTYPDPSLGYIQQSLAALSDTYQHFFDIASLVQTLLPH